MADPRQSRFTEENCKRWESIFAGVSSVEKLTAACDIFGITLDELRKKREGSSETIKMQRSEELHEKFLALHSGASSDPIVRRADRLLEQSEEFLDKFIANDCVLDREEVFSDEVLQECEKFYKPYDTAARATANRANIVTREEYMDFIQRPFSELSLFEEEDREKRFLSCFEAMQTKNQLEMLQILHLHGNNNLEDLLTAFKAKQSQQSTRYFPSDRQISQALNFEADDLFTDVKSVSKPKSNKNSNIGRAISSITAEIERGQAAGYGLDKAKIKDQKRKEQQERQPKLYQFSFLDLTKSAEEKRIQFVNDFLEMSSDEQRKILEIKENFNIANLEALSAQLEKNIKSNDFLASKHRLQQAFKLVQDVIFSVQLTELEQEVRTHHEVKRRSDNDFKIQVEPERKVEIPIDEPEIATILDLARDLKKKQLATLENLSMQSVKDFCQDIADFENAVTRSTVLSQEEKLKFMLLAGGLLGAVIVASVITGGLALASGPATIAAFSAAIEGVGIGIIIKSAALGALSGVIATSKLIYDNPTKFFDKPSGISTFAAKLKNKVDSEHSEKNKTTVSKKSTGAS